MARVPLYKTAEAEMIRRIETGAWPPGLRLPNEFGLADEFGVSQGTMRRALMNLDAMGLLERKPGRGTVVADPKARSTPAAGGAGAMLDSDDAPLTLTPYRARGGTRGADAEEAALFGTERLATLERTLRRNGSRAALDEVVVPEALIPALDEDGPADISGLLTAAGLAPARVADQLGATITSMSDAVALSCDRHTALLVLTRIAWDGDGRAIGRQVLRVIATGIRYSPCGPPN